jgi:[ribosomal protein S5]-alanine N-acetyltransferase
MELKTRRLKVVLQTPEEVERMIREMPADQQAQVSADWLARMRASKVADPWTHAFRVVQRDTDSIVGTCSFKGPPTDGVVEIAYGIEPGHEGKGYATEAAQALVGFAFSRGGVCLIRAHTLPDGASSKRVLVKCGFRYVGEIVDAEDGVVSRFERALGDPESTG